MPANFGEKPFHAPRRIRTKSKSPLTRVPPGVAGVGVKDVGLHPQEYPFTPLRGALAILPLQAVQLDEVGVDGAERDGAAVDDDR
jgi:hypothetical protein